MRCPVSEAGAAVMLWLLSSQTDSPDIVAPSTHTPTKPKHTLIQTSLQQMLMCTLYYQTCVDIKLQGFSITPPLLLLFKYTQLLLIVAYVQHYSNDDVIPPT